MKNKEAYWFKATFNTYHYETHSGEQVKTHQIKIIKVINAKNLEQARKHCSDTYTCSELVRLPEHPLLAQAATTIDASLENLFNPQPTNETYRTSLRNREVKFEHKTLPLF